MCEAVPFGISAVAQHESSNQRKVVGKLQGIAVARHPAERWWEG